MQFGIFCSSQSTVYPSRGHSFFLSRWWFRYSNINWLRFTLNGRNFEPPAASNLFAPTLVPWPEFNAARAEMLTYMDYGHRDYGERVTIPYVQPRQQMLTTHHVCVCVCADCLAGCLSGDGVSVLGHDVTWSVVHRRSLFLQSGNDLR